MAFMDCQFLRCIRVPESVAAIGSACPGIDPEEYRSADAYVNYANTIWNDFVVCYTPFAAACSYYPVYIGGGLSDLPEDKRYDAGLGFLYAMEHGIHEIDPWKEEYLDFIRTNISEYLEEDPNDGHNLRYFHLFFIQEELLDKDSALFLLDEYKESEDLEVKAALIEYYHERFGSDDPEGLSV